MKTKQEIFNHVVTSLRVQNKKSIGHDGVCMYRGPNGTKCAAGWLLPDDKYTPSMECKAVHTPIFNYENTEITDAFISMGYGASELMLLRSLQTVHDSYPVDRWESKFEDTAHEYELTMPA